MNENLKKRIIGHVKNLCSPDMIMVFGSFARGEQNKNSDLDLIVVCKQRCRKRMLERQIKMNLRQYGLNSDILIKSHKEIRVAIANKYCFLGSVLKEGKIIHKTNNLSLVIH